jgi:hypothetical protein
MGRPEPEPTPWLCNFKNHALLLGTSDPTHVSWLKKADLGMKGMVLSYCVNCENSAGHLYGKTEQAWGPVGGPRWSYTFGNHQDTSGN